MNALKQSFSLICVLFLSVAAQAGTYKGKIILNDTSIPTNQLRIEVRSNFDGGPALKIFPVAADGTFKISTSSIFSQQVELLLPQGRSLHISANNKELKKKLEAISIHQLDSVEAQITIKGGGDVNTWLSTYAPNNRLKVKILSQVEGQTTLQSSLDVETKKSSFVIPNHFVLQTGATPNKSLKLEVSLRTVEYGSGTDGTPSLATLKYDGALARNAFQNFSNLEADLSVINMDITSKWSGLVSLDGGGYANISFESTLECVNGALKGSVTVVSHTINGETMPEKFALSGGTCVDGHPEFYIEKFPLYSYGGSVAPEVVRLDAKFGYVSTGSASIFVAVKGKHLGNGWLARHN